MANSDKSLSKVSALTFIGMTCALVASIRNIPNVAATGWTLIFYMLVAVLLYALPIAMVAGEYAGMYQQEGGPEMWVTNALGKKWGFVVSWLLWVQMFPGMVMIASALAPLLAIIVGHRELGDNNIFTFAVTLVIYWGVTLLNMKFDMAKFGGKIAIWIGLYIPLSMILILGALANLKVGFMPDSTLGAFAPDKLVPDVTTETTMQFIAPIMFIYTGIEMSSVYITRLNNPIKTYVRSIFIALGCMFVLNTISGMMLANVVPAGKMDLNNIGQSIEIFAKILGLPDYTANIFSILVFVGVIVQLSAWVTGPSKTITNSARRGQYPPKLKYWKTNKFDVSIPVILTQAIVITLFSLVYLLIPAVNKAFLMLVSATAIIYSIVYVIMAIGIIRLRKTQPDLKRAFKIGSDGTAKAVVTVLILTIVIAIGLTFMGSSTESLIGQIVITLVLFLLPFWFIREEKPEWAEEVAKELGTVDNK